jgi:hypothetical protein
MDPQSPQPSSDIFPKYPQQVPTQQIPTQPVPEVPVQQTYTTPPVYYPEQPKKHYILGKILIFVFILGICVVGVGAYYARVFESPKDTIVKSIQSITTYKTAHNEIVISLENAKTFSGSLTISGNTKQNDEGKLPDVDQKINLSTNMFSGSMEIKFVNETFYMRIVQFPLLAFMGMSDIQGKWYSISQSDIEGYRDQYAGMYVDEDKSKNTIDIQTLFSVLEDNGAIYINRKGLTDFIKKNSEGEYVRMYEIEIDKYALSRALVEVSKTYADESVVDEEELSKSIESSFEGVLFGPIEIGVGLFDGGIRSIETVVSSSDKSSLDYGDIRTSIIYSNINDEVEIEIPRGATSLKDLIQSSMSANTLGATSTGF